ncbi:hypothetical protein A0H81_00872 [Grifola frondosa]|uniref:Uncharacterized protein n=1 Tax=Grifola frondosa TaxID=5627 RepID=A0A1C7MPF3_GRIFR|nr:hypothetical protein A0H81_00872 [Grifola frondosa]
MRFHSPAPWEMDEDDPVEEEEPEPKRPKRKKADKGDSGKKSWALPTGRGSSETRPSMDSTRSQGKAKQSFETMSSFSSNGGALLALAQASMSSTSLALAPSPQSSLRDKLSIPRLRSRTSSSANPPDIASTEQLDSLHPTYVPHSIQASPISRVTSPASSESSYVDERSFPSRSPARAATPQSAHYHEYTHPYANPDLVRAVARDDPPLSSPRQAIFAVNRSESSATLTDTTPSSSMSQFRSTTTMTLTPVTSMSSVNPSLNESCSSMRAGGVQGKGISAPMPVNKAALRPVATSMLNGTPTASPITSGTSISPSVRNRETMILSGVTMGGLSGWNENGGTSSLKLISLEEAQAQVRERSRSATTNPTISSPLTASLRPQDDEWDQQGQHVRTRVRSTSAGGVKAKSIVDVNQRVPPIPSDSPVQTPYSAPSRTVIRKKSGFMRLFNAKDRDRSTPNSPPPPVPSLSSDATSLHPNPPPPPRSRHGSTQGHRVPVPPLSPSLRDETLTGSGSSSETPSDSPGSMESGHSHEQQLSARRKVPELSIVTSPSMVSLGTKMPYNAPLSAASDITHLPNPTTPTTIASRSAASSTSTTPISAPSSKTDFWALSLRPVSTLFTRDLKNHLVEQDESSPRDSRPSLDIDTGTPTTGTTAISPLSPAFPVRGYSRTSEQKAISVVIAQDDQSSVIQALQEQISTARRAWQRQIWELEGQVRDLKAEVEELHAVENSSSYCSACGRGGVPHTSADENGRLEDLKKAGVKVGVVNRPRARTGVGSRFASGT